VQSSSTFDYIVVGAGSAGCAVAARLCEEGRSVLLLEAGNRGEGRQFTTPALAGLFYKSEWDWDLMTEPEAELGGRRTYLPRGRVLGGTSAINAMIYMRGNPGDYDSWAALGASGWAYEDVLPYFIRAEDNARGPSELHGVGGPLPVSDGRFRSPLVEAWVESAVALGMPRNDDFNGGSQTGVGYYQVTQRDGRRMSSSMAYLTPLRDGAELTISTGSYVSRVLLEGERAIGVEAYVRGAPRTFFADEEVILSAGAYHTPQILMLSGVGPEDHLRTHDVPVVVNNPAVGSNLQDHVGCFMSHLSQVPGLYATDTPAMRALHEESGSGPLASNGPEAGAFANLPGESSDIPQLQFHAVAAMFYDEGLSPAYDHAFSLAVYVNRPKSSGRVLLRSRQPLTKPRIFHNYLHEPEDRRVLRDGIAMAMDTITEPPLRDLLKRPSLSAAHGLAPASASASDIDSYISRTAFSFFHPVGTAAIGSVVDCDLNVLGVDRLRVADASVMPSVIAGNTNAPAIMIGERAAAFITGRRA
jgi:choline dehydrogenase